MKILPYIFPSIWQSERMWAPIWDSKPHHHQHKRSDLHYIPSHWRLNRAVHGAGAHSAGAQRGRPCAAACAGRQRVRGHAGAPGRCLRGFLAAARSGRIPRGAVRRLHPPPTRHRARARLSAPACHPALCPSSSPALALQGEPAWAETALDGLTMWSSHHWTPLKTARSFSF